MRAVGQEGRKEEAARAVGRSTLGRRTGLQKWMAERVWEVCVVRGRDGSKGTGETVVLTRQEGKGEFLYRKKRGRRLFC
jgi:hypothetical protein